MCLVFDSMSSLAFKVTPFSQPPPAHPGVARAGDRRTPQHQPRHQPQSRAPPGLHGAAATLSPPSSTISSASSSSSDSNFRLSKSSSTPASNTNPRSSQAVPSRNALPAFHTGAMLQPPPQLTSNSAPSVISPPAGLPSVRVGPTFISPPSSSSTTRVQGSSGAHAGASFNQSLTASGDVKKPKNTEKLLHQILARNPQLTSEQADLYIQKLRASRNGKLSGLSVQDIIKGVEALMREDGLARREVIEENSENECSICFEIMRPRARDVRSLPCSHRFHSSCINVSVIVNQY